MTNVTQFENNLAISPINSNPETVTDESQTLFVITAATLGQGAITSFRVYIFGLLGVFMTTGNLLTLYAVVTTDRLRVKSYAMMTSLVVTDVLFGLSVIHFVVHESLARLPCSFATYRSIVRPIERLVARTSTLHIAAIAFDRFIAVLYPLHYDTRVTSTKLGILITSLWFTSTLLSLPTYLSFTPFGPDVLGSTCIVTMWPFFEAISDSTVYLFNSAVVVFVYVKLWSIAMQHVTKITPQLFPSTSARNSRQTGNNHVTLEEVQPAARDSTGGNVPRRSHSPAAATAAAAVERLATPTGPSINARHTEPEMTARQVDDVTTIRFTAPKLPGQRRATRTVLAITASYIVMWFPYQLSLVLQVSGKSGIASASLEVFGTVLGSANIALNVVVYASVNRDFRAAFKRILSKMSSNAIQ